MKKIVFVLLLVITVLLSLYNITYAVGLDGIMDGADNFMDAGKNSGNTGLTWAGITNASDLIYNTLLSIGVVVAVVVAAYLGIKFITSSVEEQAKVKESLIPFVVGCVVIFGAFGIWKLVTNLLETL
ncbi:MAG: hypothetical protein J6A29_03970 [Clostridia bacterium]|nr:hypothetical protein [Clostridia bacterium]